MTGETSKRIRRAAGWYQNRHNTIRRLFPHQSKRGDIVKKSILLILRNLEEIIAGICLAVMVAITFCNVVGRYFFTRPITWGDEFAMMLAAWATFLGMSAAYKRNQHLGMEFFLNRMKPEYRLRLQGVMMVVMVMLCGVLTVVSWRFVAMTSKRTSIMRVSYKFVYASAAVGFTFMTFHSLRYLYQSLFQKERFRERYFPAVEEELGEGEEAKGQ